MISNISIDFAKFQDLSSLISTLQSASWNFANNVVKYSYYQGIDDQSDNEFTGTISNWPSIETLLTEKLRRGYNVSVELEDDRNVGWLQIVLIDETITRLKISFFAPLKRIPDCWLLTDFTLYARSLVYSLYEAGYTILKVTYEDDFY